MAADKKPQVGTITWHDLTVPDAEAVRKFYCEVVGWDSAGQDMGGYEDHCLNLPANGETAAGICHARGPNAKLPPQWLMYITVADVAQSAKRCQELGGKVVDGPRPLMGGQFCVIQDPAGAVAALYAPA